MFCLRVLIMIMSDTVDPVMEAGAALEKYFNVVPEESEIEEAEAGEVEAVLPALPSEDTMAGEMETESSGQVTEMPAPDFSEGVGDEDTRAEVLETEDQDLPGSTPDTAADTGVEEGSVQEPSSSTGGQCSAVFVLKHLSTKVPPASQDSSVRKAAELAVPELEVASATRKVLENIALSIN